MIGRIAEKSQGILLTLTRRNPRPASVELSDVARDGANSSKGDEISGGDAALPRPITIIMLICVAIALATSAAIAV